MDVCLCSLRQSVKQAWSAQAHSSCSSSNKTGKRRLMGIKKNRFLVPVCHHSHPSRQPLSLLPLPPLVPLLVLLLAPLQGSIWLHHCAMIRRQHSLKQLSVVSKVKPLLSRLLGTLSSMCLPCRDYRASLGQICLQEEHHKAFLQL